MPPGLRAGSRWFRLPGGSRTNSLIKKLWFDPRRLEARMVGVSYGGALALALGDRLGSIPFGLVLTKLFGAGDLRSIGSGNIGATNVLRTGRKGLAGATLVFDVLKVIRGPSSGLVGVRTANGARRGGRRGPRPCVSALAQVSGRQGRCDLSRLSHWSGVAGGGRVRSRLARGRSVDALFLRGGAGGDGRLSDRRGGDWRERRGPGLRRAVGADLV